MEGYLKLIPCNVSLLSAYSSVSTSWVLFNTAYKQIIPKQLHNHGRNELYDAAQAYLSTKIGPKNHILGVGKLEQKKNVSVAIAAGGKVEDTFRGIPITWLCVETEKSEYNDDSRRQAVNKCSYWMSFDRKEVLKFYRQISTYDRGSWKAVEFHHPASFDTLALDPKLKKAIIDDLDRFMALKDFYKRVGKAWKRGYLLHGPPGTGKSSLIAAMANYLNFDVYDLELGNVGSDGELRKLLLNTTNRSILIIEDIGCNSEVHDRSKITDQKDSSSDKYNKTFTLSTLLNCIDGLWSSCGEVRIVVFTTNHKEVLDPALLRPGRMDMHINISYRTSQGFRVLAFNYLGIHDHKLFKEIDGLMENTKVIPAALAEELLKSDDADVAFREVMNFLSRKKMEEVQIDGKDETQRLRTV
ncbi:Mitochondrial chaperone BCS1, putative [Ricinus communis]|uniref:Mitochondrial chaperone BCS1, putative n=1 Tax=Ricinus communis TaxID=3988 RepID=B9S6B2_RICCO|nr:Mitochondrial chaperone BCS1, putative [Ricinus communis]